MNIIVYSGADCPWCDKAKALLSSKGLAYTECLINVDIELVDFRTKFPGVLTVPFITIDDEWVRGFEKLTAWLDARMIY